jgi:hypothetical protein
MSNRTMFSDSDLPVIEQIVQDLKIDNKSVLKIRGYAHDFFMNNRQDPTHKVDITTEAWINAVVQYLFVCGYEIKKRD